MEGREEPQSLGVRASDPAQRKKSSRDGRISQNPAAEGNEARRDLMTDHQVCGTAESEPGEVETLNSGIFWSFTRLFKKTPYLALLISAFALISAAV